MNTLKPAVLAIASALASDAAFADQSAELRKDQDQGSVRFISGVGTPHKEIDNFLADSRKFLGL